MMSNMEGKKVPQVTFRTRQGDKWVDECVERRRKI